MKQEERRKEIRDKKEEIRRRDKKKKERNKKEEIRIRKKKEIRCNCSEFTNDCIYHF